MMKMSIKAKRLPRIDFSGVDPSAPGSGTWSAVRTQVLDALTTFGCFDAHCPALTPELRAERRNNYGADKPYHGYIGGLPSLAIVDGTKPEHIRAFANLMWLDGRDNSGFCETVHGAAKRIAELEEAVRRMVMEGLGVAKYHEPLNASTWHSFRMFEYKAPNAAEKTVRYGSHQDTNMLSVVCQHEVEGLEVQARDGDWIPVRPSPTSLIVMAWTNDRLHAPFHRITVSGDVTRYSAILFSVPNFSIQAADELVDDEHTPRFKPHDNIDFIRFWLSEEGGRHEDKLKAYCGL